MGVCSCDEHPQSWWRQLISKVKWVDSNLNSYLSRRKTFWYKINQFNHMKMLHTHIEYPTVRHVDVQGTYFLVTHQDEVKACYYRNGFVSHHTYQQLKNLSLKMFQMENRINQGSVRIRWFQRAFHFRTMQNFKSWYYIYARGASTPLNIWNVTFKGEKLEYEYHYIF